VTRKQIAFADLTLRSIHLWDRQWLLLTAGNFAQGRFNTMTVGWGSLGTMWGRPFAQVVVRPSRYTYQFIEQHEAFTLCAFSEVYRPALQLLGTRSGRDGDKVAQSGLTPIASTKIAAPGFAEAELILECRKIYSDDMRPAQFLAPDIDANYPARDYHRIYFGEILAILGTASYVDHRA
jgi:flavin reductase (DIM6/NTAB) family NADH-FMN oxidoreductase RutF